MKINDFTVRFLRLQASLLWMAGGMFNDLCRLSYRGAGLLNGWYYSVQRRGK